MEKETLLYKYFEGSLSANEQSSFETYLKKDKDFRLQFELEKDVQMAVRNSERESLKKKLQYFESKRSEPSAPRRQFWTPLRIAASIAILFGATWFVFNSDIFNTPADLYASNYEKYPNTAYTITRGDTSDTSLERKAFEAYERNDYDNAVIYLIDLKKKTGLDYAAFYLGQSYLANGNASKAITVFKEISTVNSDFKGEALWYSALAHLKLKENVKAKALLKTLLEEGNFKKIEAKQLLEDLN